MKKRRVKRPATKKKAAKKAAVKKSVPRITSVKKTTTRKPASMKARRKKRKYTKRSSSNGVNKAQAIRDMAKQLGKKARPRDIIAALAVKKISVSSPQVSSTLKAAGMRRGRRRRKVVAAVAAKPASSNGHGLEINELVKAKKLAEEVGGTAKLKELAAALERLM
jgi:hypothetical protein